MIAIATPVTYPAIDRPGLAQRIENAKVTYDALMNRGLAIETLRMPTHTVAAHLADYSAKLCLGLETGASDQDLFGDYARFIEFEAAAEVWLTRTERYPAPEGEA